MSKNGVRKLHKFLLLTGHPPVLQNKGQDDLVQELRKHCLDFCLAQQRARQPYPSTAPPTSCICGNLDRLSSRVDSTVFSTLATEELRHQHGFLHCQTNQAPVVATTTGTSTTLSDKTCTTNATRDIDHRVCELGNLDGFQSNLDHGDQPLHKNGGVDDLRRTAIAENQQFSAV